MRHRGHVTHAWHVHLHRDLPVARAHWRLRLRENRPGESESDQSDGTVSSLHVVSLSADLKVGTTLYPCHLLVTTQLRPQPCGPAYAARVPVEGGHNRCIG